MATNDVYLRPDAGDGTNSVRLRPDGPSGGVSYTLALAAGSYTYTGIAAQLTVARNLPLAAGAYSYSGKTASLNVARNLPLAAGAYAYAGNNATLTYVPGASAINYTLDLAPGVYGYQGGNAQLDYRQGAVLRGGHFGFDDKKRAKRIKDEVDAERRRKEIIAAAFAKLTEPEKKVAAAGIVGRAQTSVNWEPIVIDVARYKKALKVIESTLEIMRDEQDIEDMLTMDIL